MILKILLSLFVFFSLSHFANSKGSKKSQYFHCSFSDRPLIEPDLNLIKKDKVSYFDKVFKYDPALPLKVHLVDRGALFGFSKKQNITSAGYLNHEKRVDENKKLYPIETFDIYRFDFLTKILVHSSVYRMEKKYFEYSYWDDLRKYQNAHHLFNLFDFKDNSNHIKVGWDKSFWQCKKISYLVYIQKKAVNITRQLLSD